MPPFFLPLFFVSMKNLIIIVLVLFSGVSFGQFITHYDTIKLKKTPLSGTDSVDIKFAENPTAFDGGVAQSGANLTVNNVVNRISGRWLIDPTGSQPTYFSALPYLGFTYSFGAQGSQYLRAYYSQAFNDSLVLNIYYNKALGNGYYRNSAFDRNKLQLSLIRQGTFYSFKLNGLYSSGNFQHSGGLRTDTLIELYGLEFSPVNKNDAQSKYRNAQISFSNYFDVVPSEKTAIGVLHKASYSIVNRKYGEIDTLTGIYSTINFNSDTTQDEYNLPSISNFGGVFLQRGKFYFDGGIQHTYWNYLNMTFRKDTTELDITSKLDWSLFNLDLRNDFKLNLFGRYNEWYDHADVFAQFGSFKLKAWMRVGQYALDPFRRYFVGNTFDYSTTGAQKEFKVQVGGEVNTRFWEDKISVKAGLNQFTSPNLYVFNGQNWQNDSLNNVSISQLSLSPSLHLGYFNMDNRIIYNLMNIDMMPQFQFFSRMYFKGKVFEAKRLELTTGIDFQYNTSYNVFNYVPALDIATIGAVSPSLSSSRTNMDAFINFGLERFSFYFRYENIAYYWEDQLRMVVENYPIAAPRMRIGIAWDFFN